MILITGSNTLTGKNITARLISDGYKIRCLDDYSSKNIPVGCESVNSTLPDMKTLKNACEGVDTVIHLLGMRKKGYIKRSLVKKTNIDLVRNLLLAASNTGVKKIIFMSSHEVYGSQKKFPLGEDLKLKPNTRFGKDKAKAEKLLLEQIKKNNLDITIIRPALIAGPGTDEPMLLITLFMALAMEEDNRLYLAGNGENRYQMISPDDIASAVSLILKTPGSRGKVYNLGSDNVPTQIEQIIKQKEHSRLNCSIKHLSPFFAKLLSFIFKPMKINYLTKEHIQFLTNTMVLDCQKAKSELGWAPVKDNLTILTETIDWYKEEKL